MTLFFISQRGSYPLLSEKLTGMIQLPEMFHEYGWDNYNGKSTEFVLAPPDNMRLWRLAGTAIGRFMFLLRRSSERVYAPGGIGVDSVRREFETLAAAE